MVPPATRARQVLILDGGGDDGGGADDDGGDVRSYAFGTPAQMQIEAAPPVAAVRASVAVQAEAEECCPYGLQTSTTDRMTASLPMLVQALLRLTTPWNCDWTKLCGVAAIPRCLH